MSATVRPSQWRKLEEFMEQARISIPLEGDGVLIHECHYNAVTSEILFLESYASEKDLLKHAQAFAPVMESHPVDWEINRIDLLGSYSEETLEMMKSMAGGAFLNFYSKVFRSK